MGRGFRPVESAEGSPGLRGSEEAAPPEPLLDYCSNDRQRAVLDMLAELESESNGPVGIEDLIRKAEGQLTSRMVRETVDALLYKKKFEPPHGPLITTTTKGSLSDLRTASKEDYFAAEFLPPAMTNYCGTDQEEEILRMVTGMSEGGDIYVSTNDLLDAAEARMSRREAVVALNSLTQQEGNRPAMIIFNSEGRVGPEYPSIFEQKAYALQRGKEAYALRAREVVDRERNALRLASGDVEEALATALIYGSPFEEGGKGSVMTLDEIASRAAGLAPSANVKEHAQKGIDSLVDRGALVEVAEGKYRLRDRSDGLTTTEWEALSQFKEQFGDDPYSARVRAIVRRNDNARQEAKTYNEKALVAYMENKNPNLEYDQHSTESLATSLHLVMSREEVEESLQSLVARGVVEERQQGFLLSPRLAFAS